MKKTNQILKRILVYSWQASPITFSLLILISIIFCGVKFMEIVVFENLIDGVTLVYNGQHPNVVLPSLLTLGFVLVLTPIMELLEFLARGYFWRRGHGHMQYLFHEQVSSKSLIEFEDHDGFDHMKKASLGSSEAPNTIRILIQTCFLYLPFFFLVAIYLWKVKPMMVIALSFIFLPSLVTEIVKMNATYDFEDKIAGTRRQVDYYEKCMVDKDYFKETLQNNAHHYFNGKLLVAIDEFNAKHKKLLDRGFCTESYMNVLNILGYAGVLGLLLHYLLKGEISVSEFAAIYYAIDKMAKMMKRLITDIGEVLEELATTSFFIDFLHPASSNKHSASLPKKAAINLSSVSFTYPNQCIPAITDLSLKIPYGSSMAIVGENGSGKSTLSKLILGLYEPSTGVVTFGGRDINSYQASSKYAKTSAVFQDFSKYKLSVEDNVKLSDTATSSDVRQAISKSNFSLNKLSQSTKTLLAREFGGQDLSGGEWQRLAIARGLYRNHDIIVLDEPTAAIDPIEEEHVFQTFRKASQDKTSILVTHRLGSVQFADMIAVMDSGRLVELGKHDELLSMKGKYYDLFMAQAKWYQRESSC